MSNKPEIKIDQQNSSIGIGAAFEGSVQHVNQYIDQTNISERDLTETAEEIHRLLDCLKTTNPTIVEVQRIVEDAIYRMPTLKSPKAIEQVVKSSPTLQARLRSSLTAATAETVKVIFAPSGIAIEAVKAWLNPT